MFKGRKLVIATKHRKEKVIAPVIEKALGISSFTAHNLDTDLLGTFTGEIERKYDPVTTARKKCYMAMDLTNCDLAIASEGSFGPHPTIHFISADDEFLLFIDRKNELEIIVRELSIETNFNGAEIKTEESFLEFANKANFPSHALILRKSINDFTGLIKGIMDMNQLKNCFHELITDFGSAYVETDMRAMYNPTRMKIIELAAIKLADTINICCPKCGTPGFSIIDSKSGLPCELCCLPTRSTMSYIRTCKKCNYKMEEKFPHGKQTEIPMYCDYCNP